MSPGTSCRPRRASGSPFTRTVASARNTRTSPPPPTMPASFRSWPRRIISPRMGTSCGTSSAVHALCRAGELLPFARVQRDLAQAQLAGRDLDAFVGTDELERLVERQLVV